MTEMVLRYRSLGYSPQQCQLLEVGYQTLPGYCCFSPARCVVPGTTVQIQTLLAYVGGRYSIQTPPADPMSLYGTLRAGNPVIAFIRISPYAAVGHFIVLRGIRRDASGRWHVLVNDPLSFFPTEVEYPSLLNVWQSSIVVF